MFIENLVLSAEVVECSNQTVTVKGLPFWFLALPNKWIISGTDIKVVDYVGTELIGLVYLDKPIQLKVGEHLNIAYK